MPELRDLFSDLIRLETELWDAVDRRLRAELGVSMATFDILQVISRKPECRVHDIAQELSITVGGTSKAVDRIEAQGRLARRSNPGDRRSSLIGLTPAGEELLAAASALVDGELGTLLGPVLSPAALDGFAACLTRLRSAVARPGTDSGE